MYSTNNECENCIHNKVCGRKAKFNELKNKVKEIQPDLFEGFRAELKCSNYYEGQTSGCGLSSPRTWTADNPAKIGTITY